MTATGFKVHVELAVRRPDVLRTRTVHFTGADVINLPRRPNGAKTIHPKEAVSTLRQLSPDYSRVACPHLTAYDYKSQSELLNELKAYKDFGVTQALFVRGETVSEAILGTAFPSVEFRSKATLRMLNWCRSYCEDNGIEIAVAGQMPMDEKKSELTEKIKRETDHLYEKIERGAKVVLTQPVHDLKMFEEYCRLIRLYELYKQASFRAGVALWQDVRAAIGISRRIRGIHVPAADLQRLSRFAGDPRSSSAIGAEIAGEKIQEVLKSGLFGGIIVFPFGEEALNRVPEFIGSVRRAEEEARNKPQSPLVPGNRHLRVVR